MPGSFSRFVAFAKPWLGDSDLCPAHGCTAASGCSPISRVGWKSKIEFSYLSGFRNKFASDAIPGALQGTRNSPQVVPLGLHAEQISSTPFTVQCRHARRTWLYQIRPSAIHPPYWPIESSTLCGPLAWFSLNRLRWRRLPFPSRPADFVAGIVSVVANADTANTGIMVHVCRANQDMTRVSWTAVGEFLIVPQLGRLVLTTERGHLVASPRESCDSTRYPITRDPAGQAGTWLYRREPRTNVAIARPVAGRDLSTTWDGCRTCASPALVQCTARRPKRIG